MAFNQRQGRVMVDCEYPLRRYFGGRDDVLVAHDLRVFYSEGPPPQDVAPDVFVVFGVPSYLRDIYRIAEESKAPDWVLEIASKSTYQNDVKGKKDLYQALGVGEYFVYDPKGGMHDPRLRGWTLHKGRYKELTDLQRPGVDRALWSAALGLELHFVGDQLRLWNPSTRAYLETIDEAQDRADRERDRADRAEAKLKAEGQVRREAEQRAESEARARRRLEARLAELESKSGHS